MAESVDVTAHVEGFRQTITDLENEIAEEQEAFDEKVGVKRAQVAALKRALKAAEVAADPNIEPKKRPGRKKAAAAA